MLVTRLKSFLINVYNDTYRFSTILISGKWGCGKTYSIKEFINSEEKPNVIYLSLFGLNNKNDVYSILSERLDSSFLMNVNKEYFVKPLFEKNDYKHTIIIFDDLERKGKDLTYSVFYGIVDALRKVGVKVVCVINDEVTKGDAVDFNSFKEKTFDVLLSVEADGNVLIDIIKDSAIGIDESIIKDVNENWRTIERAKMHYDNILSQINQRGLTNFYERSGISETLLFKYVALATRCLYAFNENKPTFKDDDYGSFSYERRVSTFGEYAANELFTLKEKESAESIYKIEELMLLIRDSDYDKYFARYYYQKDSILEESNILNYEPFFLDDEGKDNYRTEFLKKFKEMDFSTDRHERILLRFLSNFIDKIDEKDKEMVAERIVETVNYEDSKDLFGSIRLSENGEVSNAFMQLLSAKYSDAKSVKNEITLGELIKEGQFVKLTDYLYDNRYALEDEKKAILQVLEKHDYALPDLSKTIDYSSWTYCHEVAKFVSKTEFKESFIDVLGNQCKKNKRSISLREKCNALINYNIDKTIDFFKLYPLKKDKIQ